MLATSRGFFSVAGQRDDERVSAVRAVLDSIGPHDSVERANLLATLGAELLFTADLDQSKALLGDSVAMARRLGDDAVLARTLNFFTALQADVFDLESMRSMARGALEIAERTDDPALATMAASGLHILACRAGDRVEADAALGRQIEHTERARQPLLVFLLANALALRAIGEGRLDEGERLAEDMLEVGSESASPTLSCSCRRTSDCSGRRAVAPKRRYALYNAAATVLPTAGAILVHALAELGDTDRAGRALAGPDRGRGARPPDRSVVELRHVVVRRGVVVPRRSDVCRADEALEHRLGDERGDEAQPRHPGQCAEHTHDERQRSCRGRECGVTLLRHPGDDARREG